MELLILIGLIILNGVFAMSEMAVVSTRKARLQERIDNGDANARAALDLAENPNRFLSTVQIGITLVGVGAGAFGGSALAQPLADTLRQTVPALDSYANQISFLLIVGLTTYLSLVIGELVPKRIALSDPEQFASLIARPMTWLSRLAAPLVFFLSRSTEFVAGLLGIRAEGDDRVTEYEIIALVREGVRSGEIESAEHDMVRGVFDLDARLVSEILTPRNEIVWFDIDDTSDAIRDKLLHTTFSAYPVAQGDLDRVLGVVRSKDLLTQLLDKGEVDLKALLLEPLIVPETVYIADVLQHFKQKVVHVALVIDEYGSLEGLITLNDIVEEIVGDVDMEDPQIVQRVDGSWLLDGYTQIAQLQATLTDFAIPDEEDRDYQTLAGFILKRLGRVPQAAETFRWQGYDFEVMDMDGNRVDKVMITRREIPQEAADE